MRTKIITIFLALVTSVGMIHAININGINYHLHEYNHTAEVISGGNYVGKIMIPGTITFNNTTYRVTRIGDYAFEGCKKVTSIYLPKYLESVGEGAFNDCPGTLYYHTNCSYQPKPTTLWGYGGMITNYYDD